MHRIKSTFLADLITLKHAKNPDNVLEALKYEAAVNFGKEIINKFPYIKDESGSFKGTELPESTMNRDHIYNDRYTTELIILDVNQFSELCALIQQMKDSEGWMVEDTYNKIKSILS